MPDIFRMIMDVMAKREKVEEAEALEERVRYERQLKKQLEDTPNPAPALRDRPEPLPPGPGPERRRRLRLWAMFDPPAPTPYTDGRREEDS